MPRAAMTVTGLGELQRQLRRVKDRELDKELKDIHKELADEIIRRALPNVPVRSGKLKSTVRSSGTKKSAIGRAGKARVPYAPVIHWGSPSRGIPARPFLRNAAEVIERDVVDRYETQIARMLNRVVR